MATNFLTIFSNAFTWMKIYDFFITILMKYIRNGPINNIPALVQMMAWRRPGDKPLSEPVMVSWLTHICVTQSQRVKGIVTNELCFMVVRYLSVLYIYLVLYHQTITTMINSSKETLCPHMSVMYLRTHRRTTSISVQLSILPISPFLLRLHTFTICLRMSMYDETNGTISLKCHILYKEKVPNVNRITMVNFRSAILLTFKC